MNRFLFALTILSAGCLLIAYLAPFISPENFPFIAFFGLAYPLLALINIIFSIYWLALRKRKFVLPMLVLVMGWFMLSNYFHFGTFYLNKNNLNNKGDIKILSYNVRLLDFDRWNKKLPDNRIRMLQLLEDESADIICLQEFYTIDYPNYHFNTLDTLLQMLNPVFYHFGCSLCASKNQSFGLLTLSRYPIIREGKVEIRTDGTNACIFTDIKKNQDTLRIYNVHLQSVYPMNASGLSRAFSQRALQADMIAEHIKKCRFPVMVCGDFNDTPSSYAYHTLKGKLQDAFLESGKGFGTTYAENIPFQRIDYIFHDLSLVGHSFHVIPEKLSDHYPICSQLGPPD